MDLFWGEQPPFAFIGRGGRYFFLAFLSPKAFNVRQAPFMDTVHTLEEAEAWFRSHASGSVICVLAGIQQICRVYDEAAEFYTEDFPPTFETGIDEETKAEWIKCLGCGLKSFMLGDVAHHYCGFCHIWHDHLWPPSRKKFVEDTPKVGKQTAHIAFWRLGTEEQAVAALERQK